MARALAEHPEFPLGAEDFVTVVADWGSKAEGVHTIAARLGIAPEAVVFADDTPFERETVRAGVPGAAVVPLDAEPALHTEHLLADGWFDTPTLTEEDRLRPARYAQRERRERFMDGSSDTTGHQAFLAYSASGQRSRPRGSTRAPGWPSSACAPTGSTSPAPG